MKLDHFLTLYTKMNLKRIKERLRPEIIKLLEETQAVTSLTLVLAISFLEMSPHARGAKAK